MMIGYLANNVLPAWGGELVRACVLGQREGVAKSTMLATIVVERVADLVVALLLQSEHHARVYDALLYEESYCGMSTCQ